MINYVGIKRSLKSPLGLILVPLIIIMAVWGGLCLATEKAMTDALAQNAATKVKLAEEAKKYDDDKRFLAIKSEVAHHWTWAMKDYSPPEETESTGWDWDMLYRLTPEYDKYMATKNDETIKEQVLLLNDRDLNYFEFNQTCNFVDALKVGDKAKAKISGNGSGWTSANFETYLKGCGDTNLTYLDELKSLHPGYEESLKRSLGREP